MNHSTPGLPVHHQLPEFTQTHVHHVGDTIQPSHPLSSPSPPAPNPSQLQGLFQWVNSSHEVAKVLEFQFQHQSFQLDSILKSRDITLPTKVYAVSYGFSSSHVWMWKLHHKESWAPKNWWFWTMVLEKTLESPLDCKEIQPVHPKGDQSWVFTERTDNEADIKDW